MRAQTVLVCLSLLFLVRFVQSKKSSVANGIGSGMGSVLGGLLGNKVCAKLACPENTKFYHYECCGSAEDGCCFKVDEYGWYVIAGAGVLLVVLADLCICCCCCCCGRCC